MFHRKKRSLFGNNVEPDCAYCHKNSAKPGQGTHCTLGLAMTDGKCKKYEYDPLMREPKPAPGLARGYSDEDFQL